MNSGLLSPYPTYYTAQGFPHLNSCLSLTSGAGVAQGAADFILVQMRPWDHQDVGDLAQGAVIRSLAPHLLRGQSATLQGRAGRDIIRARALSGAAFSLSCRPTEGYIGSVALK